jgi:hypothetical protein
VDPNGAVLLDAARISKKAHPVASEVQQMLKDKLVRSGAGRRVPTLEQTQDIAQDIMKNRLQKAVGEDRDMVQAMGERLMKSVDTAPASRFVNPQVGEPARDALKGSYDISRRQKVVKKLEQKALELSMASGNKETAFNNMMKKFLASPLGKTLTAAERADLEKLQIGGLGRLARAGRQAVEPGWIASAASAVFHPILAGTSLALKASGMAARKKGGKIAKRGMQEALRRMSTGQTRKTFLKGVKPRSSPFSAAISGQLNDEERR